MPTRIHIWLEIRSAKHSLEELSQLLGCDADTPLSHERGSPRRRDKTWEATHWRYEPAYDESDTLAEALDALLEEIPAEGWERVGLLPPECGRAVNVGLMLGPEFCYECSIRPDQMERCSEYGLRIELTMYPDISEVDEDYPRRSTQSDSDVSG